MRKLELKKQSFGIISPQDLDIVQEMAGNTNKCETNQWSRGGSKCCVTKTCSQDPNVVTCRVIDCRCSAPPNTVV